MSTSKSAKLKTKLNIEKRAARIKQAKDLIHQKSKSSLMNNVKWHALFEILAFREVPFQLKRINGSDLKACSFIRELESSALLIDDSGDFTEFLEIEEVLFAKDSDLITELESIGVFFEFRDQQICIPGYQWLN
ncbi:hypothetical protein [Croceimicrobium hydrocarbonivorans]|uniref:Uncharacterized protein n=1 Tax=Croceimicrobium hydrocarbonivorans TaxID=2761580 RepID=A0A7H0VDV9_9FLAO|nr:hypothetical protein [Croceimicrobium hydrocarbonivorans]QNR23907.1 hypothetical protein H4K34_16245 [Croceimicrobium hydrocarbonivorans]